MSDLLFKGTLAGVFWPDGVFKLDVWSYVMPSWKNIPTLSFDRAAAAKMMSEGEKRLLGYRLATANILYHMPDHPDLLQSFVWQELDLAPKFPVLNRFLKFWEREIEGRLHSVTVASSALVTPGEFDFTAGELRLQ